MELISVIEIFIDGWTHRWQPLMWAKTVDQILDKARPRKKTSNTRH